ncbi:MAG: hypothetical protein AB2L14_10215 [Candidatus Xenobiia bacterium LiM19]
MSSQDSPFTLRYSLDKICKIPDKIISVYSLEQHVWAESNSDRARKERKPELQTIREFQIEPVRPFLNDILRNMAAPYNPADKENQIGQGYWIQAEFGSGKSHLLSFLSAIALGNKEAWDIIREKETKAGRGKRESLFRFWEEGLDAKSSNGKKGFFVIVKTLVGVGEGTVGVQDTGRNLIDYIIDAVKDQIFAELGKNISLYPVELLADRFLKEDLERYRDDLKKFLKDPKFHDEDEFEDLKDFINEIQQDQSPDYKKSCGDKLWRFYTEYLKVQPQIASESEDVLIHLVNAILNEGYSGILLVLDEVSLFMKNRSEAQRTSDEKTLVVLSNRLAKVKNLPIWTVCSAQQAIESRMGVKNIIADDRLKLVKLLEGDNDFYTIVLARVREIVDTGAISAYYLHYRRGFTWPQSIGEDEFARFFPFHKPALEVLRAVAFELTTNRSAIHFMHQTLKHLIKHKGKELVRLWELFDEAMKYEEDPSGTHAGLSSIKTLKETEYKIYEACKRQIDSLTKGQLKFHHDKAEKILQTLFLYHISRTRSQGLSAEEIANSVLIERDEEANADENNEHYENIAENLKKELRQILQTYDEEGCPRYRFDPVFTGVDPRMEFQKARDEAESNEKMQRDAWEHLIALDDWPVKTRQMTYDLTNGNRSIFRDIAPFVAPWEHTSAAKAGDQAMDLLWQGRLISGVAGMRYLAREVSDHRSIPSIESDETDCDFLVIIGIIPASQDNIQTILSRHNDRRLIIWNPDELTSEEKDRLVEFAAYKKLVSEWQGKDSEDAVSVIQWVSNTLQTDMGKILQIVNLSFARGRMHSLEYMDMKFNGAGELSAILTPVVSKVLGTAYKSQSIAFQSPFIFRKEEGIKVINGIVKKGSIDKYAKKDQNISAAQNFGHSLMIMKKGNDKELDISENPIVRDIMSFIDSHAVNGGPSMKITTLYKNFMGTGVGNNDYGLTRRMVQIYLLCLAKNGKIRVGLSPKAGVSFTHIDYSTIGDMDFSAKVLESLTDIEKVARPENWDVLRPYAEKLLGRVIQDTHDEALISQYRILLGEKFADEKTEAQRIREKAKRLFDALQIQNPYEKVLDQVASLYDREIDRSDDINSMLYALKDVFNYAAYDTLRVSSDEISDLANRLKNHHDMEKLVSCESELISLNNYCTYDFPSQPELKEVKNIVQSLKDRLSHFQDYIDSEIKLKTELLGSFPPATGERATRGRLIQEYAPVYLTLHNHVIKQAEKEKSEIQILLESDELKALEILEGISALKPESYEAVVRFLRDKSESIVQCKSPSKTSIESSLAKAPVHDCGISFHNVQDLIQEARRASEEARSHFNNVLNGKIEILRNPTVQGRLSQGSSEPLIRELLECSDAVELRAYLVKKSMEDKAFVTLINKYLKKLVVKSVRLSQFKPSNSTIEKGQIENVCNEFRDFLESQIKDQRQDKDTMTVLKLE